MEVNIAVRIGGIVSKYCSEKEGHKRVSIAELSIKKLFSFIYFVGMYVVMVSLDLGCRSCLHGAF